MSLKTEDADNVFIFQHQFSSVTTKRLSESPAFETTKIPGVTFWINAKIDNNNNVINILIKKNTTRKAVSINKIEVVGGTAMTYRTVDTIPFLENSVFNNFPLAVSFDKCTKFQRFPTYCYQNDNPHQYGMTIICSVTWHGFVDALYYPGVCVHMQNYYCSKEFSDMVFNVNDIEYPAHKNVVANHSPVFYKMLTSNMKEFKESRICLPDVDADIFEELLLFFYKGKMVKAENDMALTLKLFKFAHMYQIDKLKTTCEYILIKNLDNDNVFSIYIEGKLLGSVILQQHAVTFIHLHATEMRNSVTK